MDYLLDTNICSAHLKRPAGLMHRFVQYAGRLHIPTIVGKHSRDKIGRLRTQIVADDLRKP